jgi:hypothetical protein
MAPDDLHKILFPYLWAGGLLVVVLVVVAWLLKRHGARQASHTAEPSPSTRPPDSFTAS